MACAGVVMSQVEIGGVALWHLRYPLGQKGLWTIDKSDRRITKISPEGGPSIYYSLIRSYFPKNRFEISLPNSGCKGFLQMYRLKTYGLGFLSTRVEGTRCRNQES